MMLTEKGDGAACRRSGSREEEGYEWKMGMKKYGYRKEGENIN